MKLLLCFSVALSLCSGCVSRIDRPYIKETITSKDGTVRTIETSADKIEGGGVDVLKRIAPNR
jgi:hypothetical protein